MKYLRKIAGRTSKTVVLVLVVGLGLATALVPKEARAQANTDFSTTNIVGSIVLSNRMTVPLFPLIGTQTQVILNTNNNWFGPPQSWRAMSARFRIDTWRNSNGTERVVLLDHAVNTNVDLASLAAPVAFGTNGSAIVVRAEDANWGSQSNGWFTVTSGTVEDFSQLQVGAYTNNTGGTNTTVSYIIKARAYAQ